MSAVVPFIPLIAAGSAGGTGIAAARMQSGAIRRAADTQTNAANYGADRQLEASRETERFNREAAQHAWQQQETDRRANYDQWVARERRLGSIAERLGYGARETPGYVPSVNPNFASAPPPFQPGTPQHAQWYRDNVLNASQGGPASTTMPVQYPGVDGNQGQHGHITRGGTQPLGTTAAQQPMTARDAILARRFPQGSVGAMVLARQRRPAGVGA